MKRRSFRKPVIALSLFPFLAVLVCTMGALIVLLVCVLQKARVDAADVTTAQSKLPGVDDERLSELRLEKEDLDWRRSELERQRTEFQQHLVRQRLTLSHFEDHIRRLEEQWKQLTAQAAELKRLGSQQASGEDVTQEKLAAIRSEIDQQRRLLDESKQQAAGRQRAFAIIPYDGPNGTKRRPIYIECTDQGIVLQPEGVVLAPADFEGSLGPGNPLDAALRTTREYLARYGTASDQGEPYPLLIVRPSGTVAYSVARGALKSWDDEFGYELIESDMKLAYPKPDAALKAELDRSIADARQRQVVLASIMPGRFKQSGASGLVATTNGGFAAVGGSGFTATGAGGYGGSRGSGNGSTMAQGASFSRTFHDASGGGVDRVISMGAAQQSPARTNGGRTGNSANPPLGSDQSDGLASATAGTAGQPGTAGSAPPAQAGVPGSSAGAPAGSTSGAGGNGQSGTNPMPGMRRFAPAGMQPLANSRGHDWGLPNRGQNITGIQRFLQIECHSDRLVLLQERGDYRAPTVIPMPAETVAAIEPFVMATHQRMEQWGIAGDGCYWKPILRVQVSPDAEQRYVELATLLESSGLQVQRK